MDEDDTIGKVCDEGLDSDVTRCYLVIEPVDDNLLIRWVVKLTETAG